ncbi:hypothetical protein HN371_18815 [Candidatus Poribacteria bacterium]|nr:hypothetical protein [Candidatus Poribacteria bacterium]MBT5532728.1 hypothetical protein [Candidatus Poribacteria bacterium]MBT5714314.1 hypothetical protein [Candidatus Poribacteria bacterium]MBT7097936.1 hypothetical protein [Candidatus Poribacteria bacterium]MBT7809595.1 hypothetical protein [Candidatus Poribacteria bacterium]
MTPRLITACLLVVAAVSAGCVKGGGLSHSVAERRRESQVETYEVAAAGLGAGADGYTFRNERFRFEYDPGFASVAGYETEDARRARGVEASEVLNGGYAFVRDIFGIEANKLLRVVIAPTVRGAANDAYTTTSWREIGREGRMVDGSEESVMHFGKEAFESGAVLAHEMTHTLLNAYRLPAWFAEGIATLVEVDYAKSARIDYADVSIAPIGLDENGHNVIQTWRGHASELPERSSETYGSAYAIIREIRARYGPNVYPRFFRDLRETGAHLAGDGVSLGVIIRTLSRVSGTDVAPFFVGIEFDVPDL